MAVAPPLFAIQSSISAIWIAGLHSMVNVLAGFVTTGATRSKTVYVAKSEAVFPHSSMAVNS